jgi:hypothetical protein
MGLYDADVSGLLEHFEKQSKTVCDALSIVSRSNGGPIGEAYYYLIETLRGVVKTAPFAKGDRVELVRQPDINPVDSWGWMGSKHFLVVGAKATVAAVSLRSHGWSVELVFDDESWISTWGPDQGKAMPVEPDRRHRYGFAVSYVKRIDEVSP